MKLITKSRVAVTILSGILMLSLTNCAVRVGTTPMRTTYKAKKLPPGQAKKIYGDKSAKKYAPGHNK